MAERKFLNNSANWRALGARPPGHSVRWAHVLAVLAMALGTFLPIGGLAATVQATGTVNHTGLVPWTPRLDTPRVQSGSVEDIVQWGDRIVLAGSFAQVTDNDSSVFNQPYLLAYDINTGAIDRSFTPSLDGAVQAVAVSPDGQSLYIAGLFNTVNGDTRRKIAKIGLDGSTVTAFTANADSRVSAIAVSNSAVYVGGFFSSISGTARGMLAALDPVTGAVDTGFDLPVTEGLGSGGLLKVHDVLLTPDGSRLVVVHSGRRVAGEIRTGAAVINTITKTLDPWSTGLYEDNLNRVGGVIRINAADISPDGSYFVVVSGSGGDRPPISDTAVAFPVAGGAGTEPLWVSRMFDSLFSVGISEVAVYVGGHFRWQEAPGSTDPYPGDPDVNYGWDSGLGAYSLGDEVVRRDQIGAISPATGKAMNWDPGSDAGTGSNTPRQNPDSSGA